MERQLLDKAAGGLTELVINDDNVMVLLLLLIIMIMIMI